jgi:hypothetical protein
MNKRFEIPVEPDGFNTFLIDDYLRLIQSPERRKDIIATVGYSPQLREAYEKSHGLPRGAVELAMLTEDRRFKEWNERIVKKFTGKDPGSLDQKEIQEALMQVQSMGQGLQALYPEAVHFLMQYNALSQRNKASFRGDYRFTTDYKIILAQCSSPWWYTNARVYTDTNVVWNANVAAYQQVAALLWLALAVAAAWAIFLYAWVCLVAAICPIVS